MSHLQIDAEEAHLFQRLAARIVYSDPSCVLVPHVLALNTKAQSSFVALRHQRRPADPTGADKQVEDLSIVRKFVRGHEYLHYKGLQFRFGDSQRSTTPVTMNR